MLTSKLIQLEQIVERDKSYQLFNRSTDKTRVELEIKVLMPRPQPIPYRPVPQAYREATVADRAKLAAPEVWNTAEWAKANREEEQRKRTTDSFSPQTLELMAQQQAIAGRRI